MTTDDFNTGLRWYEQWLLEFLVKSPRISRIMVEIPGDEAEEEDDVDDERFEADLRQQLEWIYHGPSADEEEQD
jgi:hypothetical protein